MLPHKHVIFHETCHLELEENLPRLWYIGLLKKKAGLGLGLGLRLGLGLGLGLEHGSYGGWESGTWCLE